MPLRKSTLDEDNTPLSALKLSPRTEAELYKNRISTVEKLRVVPRRDLMLKYRLGSGCIAESIDALRRYDALRLASDRLVADQSRRVVVERPTLIVPSTTITPSAEHANTALSRPQDIPLVAALKLPDHVCSALLQQRSITTVDGLSALTHDDLSRIRGLTPAHVDLIRQRLAEWRRMPASARTAQFIIPQLAAEALTDEVAGREGSFYEVATCAEPEQAMLVDVVDPPPSNPALMRSGDDQLPCFADVTLPLAEWLHLPSLVAQSALPIDRLCLSIKSMNALKRNNVNTLKQLSAHTPFDLLAIRNVGPGSVKEIVDRLTDLTSDTSRPLDLQWSPLNGSLGTMHVELQQGPAFRSGPSDVTDLEQLDPVTVLTSLSKWLTLSPTVAQSALPVERLRLSTRASNALELNRVETVAQLSALSPYELLGMRSIGRESVKEIMVALTQLSAQMPESLDPNVTPFGNSPQGGIPVASLVAPEPMRDEPNAGRSARIGPSPK